MSCATRTHVRVVEILSRVRDGLAVTDGEIALLVGGAARAEVPDYQLASFLMAVYQRGLSDEATTSLTLHMRDSGRVVSWPAAPFGRVDKHSTGGVGDKISLCLAPWVAACGVSVPMVCGRGLGHTGGTLDKLDSIPNFSHALSVGTFVKQVGELGVAIMGQSAEFAPADGRLYALRDVTATVESVPLITASILAKKLAEGIDALVLDVKVGTGAFMKTPAQALALARSIVRVGDLAGLRVCAVLSAMDAPLGRTIGNALEVREAICVLRGGGPADVIELSYALGARMLLLAGKVDSLAGGRAAMAAALASGAAWQRFCAMVRAQSGAIAADDAEPIRLPVAPEQTSLRAPRAGVVASLDAYALGHAAVSLGAGRAQVDDEVDPAVGIVIDRTVGDAVAAGDAVLTVHHRAPLPASVRAAIEAAIGYGDVSDPPHGAARSAPLRPLILGEVGERAPADGSVLPRSAE